MKKLFFLFLLLIPLISASTCTEPGYRWCEEKTYNYGTASTYSKIYFSFEDNYGDIWDRDTRYSVGDLYLNIGLEGRRIYDFSNRYTTWAEVDSNCNANGCTSGMIYPGRIKLASVGQEFKGCPVYVAWDKDEAPNGDWAWSYTGRGWLGTSGTCITIKSVACYDNSDCGSGQICDKSGTWQTWSCKAGEQPVTYYRFSNNQCTTVSILPSQKTTNDYNTMAECQSHICVPSSSCASNTCIGQTCADGCGGTVQGTKNCTIGPVCGNNVCESGETISGCPSDCKNEEITSLWSKVFFVQWGIEFTLPLLMSIFGGLIIVLRFLRGR